MRKEQKTKANKTENREELQKTIGEREWRPTAALPPPGCLRFIFIGDTAGPPTRVGRGRGARLWAAFDAVSVAAGICSMVWWSWCRSAAVAVE